MQHATPAVAASPAAATAAPLSWAAHRAGAAAAAPGRAVARRRAGAVVAVAMAADVMATATATQVAGEMPLPLAVVVPTWLAAFALAGLFDRRRLVVPAEEARRVLQGVSFGAVGLVLAAFALGVDLGRGWVATTWLAALVATAAARLVVRKLAHVLAGQGHLAQRVLVVGANAEARSLARTLSRRRWLGYQPAGFVAADAGGHASLDGVPVVGDLSSLREAVAELDVATVFVAGSALPAGAVAEVHAALAGLDVDVRVTAGLPLVSASRVAVEPLDGVAVLHVRPYRLTVAQAALKRAIDVTGALAALLLAAPVMAAVAIAVRATSAGPALFRQVRVGEGGREFTIYKFRTMVVDAEARKAELLDRNEADGVLFKLADDPRITRIGRTLRTLGLDELPQLLNVLKGEMSLVGPRPPLPEETELYDEWLRGRLRVKPGITGLWQVNGRHELSFDEYARYDLFYVENWSVGLDLYVIARTLPALLARRGAA